MEGLTRAGFIRKLVGRFKIQYIPELSFILDTSVNIV